MSRLAQLPFPLLFRQGCASGAVVLDCNDDKRRKHRFFELLFNIFDRFAKPRVSVGQIYLHPIRGHDYYANINFALLQFVSQVNEISHNQIASCRYLYFDAHSGENGLVISEALRPVDTAGFPGMPVFCIYKALIERLADNSAAIRVFFFEQEHLSVQDDLLNF